MNTDIYEHSVTAIVLAGGRGKRLGALTAHTPKSLMPVAGRPLLLRNLAQIERSGICDVVVVTGYLPDHIEHAAAAYRRLTASGLRMTFVSEKRGCETAMLAGLRATRTPEALVRCADDLLTEGQAQDLVDLKHFGSVLTRHVKNPGLRRVSVRGRVIDAVTQDLRFPIITYNLRFPTAHLRDWCRTAASRSLKLIDIDEYLLAKPVRAVDGDGSVGVNAVADLAPAAAWAKQRGVGHLDTEWSGPGVGLPEKGTA